MGICRGNFAGGVCRGRCIRGGEEEEEGRRWDFHLKSNNSSLTRWGTSRQVRRANAVDNKSVTTNLNLTHVLTRGEMGIE